MRMLNASRCLLIAACIVSILSLEAFSQEKSTLSLEEVKVRAIAALYDSDSISLERS
jgi:hypothetical protein